VDSGSHAKKITRSETFGGLLKTRPLAKTDRLMLHALFENTPPRFGILIPKRLANRAVDRNALKRIIREACRSTLKDYQGRFLVRLSKPVKAVGHSDRAAWWTEVQQLFSDLSRRASSRP
jgi:ribonuclease P protein component